MRDIKFRGRINLLGENHGVWETGNLERIPTYDGEIIRVNGYIVDPDTVGQFTGIHDVNGKEIYEGDTVKARIYKNTILDPDGYIEIKGKVCYDEQCGCFRIKPLEGSKCEEYFYFIDSILWEVVGNIYESNIEAGKETLKESLSSFDKSSHRLKCRKELLNQLLHGDIRDLESDEEMDMIVDYNNGRRLQGKKEVLDFIFNVQAPQKYSKDGEAGWDWSEKEVKWLYKKFEVERT